jgi:predicted RNA-binding protein associated with RNAse of E/G family
MPFCLEKKILLSGEVKTYDCRLLHCEEHVGILSHVIDREYDVNGTKLLPGDLTCAVFWPERPYTLYTWNLPRMGRTLYYFNIADSISLSPREFIWRDLVVDILIDGNGAPRMLDEHELPPALDETLHRYILSAKDHILARHRRIIAEADALLRAACA